IHRKVMNIPDVRAEASPRTQAVSAALNFRSQLTVPMIQGDAAIGAISVTRDEPGEFTEKQVAVFRTFADQAVIAIENVRLFKELEARNKDLGDALEQQTATAEILRAISGSQTTAQSVFEAIAESAMRLLGAWSVAVISY